MYAESMCTKYIRIDAFGEPFKYFAGGNQCPSAPRIEVGYTGNTKHQVATRKMVSVENEVAKKKPKIQK